MSSSEIPPIKDINTLNSSIQEVLRRNKILNTPRQLDCGEYRNVPRRGTDLLSLECGDISCPVCRYKYISKRKKEIYDLTNDFDGRFLMNTFNLSHDQRHDLPYLYNSLKKCIKGETNGLKNQYGWRKLQKDLDHQFHFDRIEITVSPDKGFHPHLHQVFCCLNWKISLEEIKNRLFEIWSRLLKINGLRGVTRDSGVTTIEGRGVIQYPFKQEQDEEDWKEVKKQISESNKRRGKRFSKKNDWNVGYSIGELEREILYYEEIPNYKNEDFSKKEIVKHLTQIQKTFKGDYYCRVYKG